MTPVELTYNPNGVTYDSSGIELGQFSAADLLLGGLTYDAVRFDI